MTINEDPVQVALRQRYTNVNGGRLPGRAGELIIGVAVEFLRRGRTVGFKKFGETICLEILRPKQTEVATS